MTEGLGTLLVKTREGRGDIFDGAARICGCAYQLSWYGDIDSCSKPVGDLRVHGTILPELVCPIGQDLILHLSATERVLFFFRDAHGAVTITGAVISYSAEAGQTPGQTSQT